MLTLRVVVLSITAAVGLVACNNSNSSPEATGPLALPGEPTGEQVSALATVDGGAIITLETPTHVYVLDIGSDAVAEDTEITLEEIVLPDLAQTTGLRMSPDGLEFLIPAVLFVDGDTPADTVLVGLAFQEGVAGAEASFAVPDGEGGASMLIRHFSSAAIADASTAAPALDSEQAALIRAQNASEAAAIGLLDRFKARVAPDIERARFATFTLESAGRAFSRFRADVVVSNAADLTGGGTVTLGEVVDTAFETLHANALELLSHRTVPVCSRERDVFDLVDFANIVQRINGVFQLLGFEEAPAPLCVSTELTATADTSALTADTNNIVVNARMQLVGFDGTREDVGASAIFFEATGASGPDSVQSATGEIAPQTFTRPTALPRPPAVTIVVSADSVDTQLEGLASPAPIVISLQEPASGDVVASPSVLAAAPGTVELCAHASVSGTPVNAFTVTWSLSDPIGLFDTLTSVTTTGEACVTWNSPADLPNVATDLGVNALIDIGGALASATTSIHINARPAGIVTFVETELSTGPGCIESNGRTELNFELQISLAGAVTGVSGTYTHDGVSDGDLANGACAVVETFVGSPQLNVNGQFPAALSDSVPPFGTLSLTVVRSGTTTRSGVATCAGVETTVDELLGFTLPYEKNPDGSYNFERDVPGSTVPPCFTSHITQTGLVIPQ